MMYESFMGIPTTKIAEIKRYIDMKFYGDIDKFLEYLENETATIQETKGHLSIADSKLKRIRDIVA